MQLCSGCLATIAGLYWRKLNTSCRVDVEERRSSSLILAVTYDCISNDASLCTQKAFKNLRHMYHLQDVASSLKGQVSTAAVGSVLIYGSETRLLRTEDLQKFSICEHQSFRGFAWEWLISNAENMLKVELKKSNRRRMWIGQSDWDVLSVPPDRLP